MFKNWKKYFCFCLNNKGRGDENTPNIRESDYYLKRTSVNVSISNLSDISMDSM